MVTLMVTSHEVTEKSVEGSGKIMSYNICNILLWSMPPRDSMEKGKGYDDTIGCAIVVSVSASCSRCYNLALS